MKRLLIGVAALAVFCTSAQAQEFWEKKPYTEWTKEQCLKVLRDSPWGKTFTISTVKQDRFGQPTTGEARQSEQRIFYYAQLRSALPVRQAVVRLAYLQGKFEGRPKADQDAFTASADRYLKATYDNIIVHIDYETNVDFFDKELAAHWQTRQPNELNSTVYLTTSRGLRISPTDFKVERGAGRAFEFIFPREVSGEPIVTPSVESIRIEFPNPQIRELNDQRTTFEFKTEKMKYKGSVIY